MPDQNRRYADKVAFVSGARAGIGRATALAFAREGASVVIADVDEQANNETAGMIETVGGRVIAVHCDVTRQDLQTAMDATVEAFGGLDVAFNNAGVEQPTAPAADITEED
jgi:NAD(P)-dependent dehydrogenase (short-subunit alcohol dehydrogenase family)